VISAEARAPRLVWPALRASTIAYATIALGLFAMWPSAVSLARYWAQILDYEHGFVVAAVSAAWLLSRRSRIDAETIKPRPLISIGLLAALFLWLVAYRGISHIAYQLLFPAILWLAVLAAAGNRVAKHVAAPLGYLYFAVPVWDYLLPALQKMTVAASEFGLGLLGVSAKVLGDRVTIPEGTFEILEGCSGKRYFIVTLAFASLVGVVNRLSPRRHLLLFAGSAAAALVANWIRVIVVIYAGHVTRMQHYWVSVEHLTLGDVIFAVLLVLVLLLARSLAGPAPAAGPARPVAAAPIAAVHRAGVWLPMAMLGALGVVGVLWPTGPRAGAAHLAGVPVLAGNWNGPLPPRGGWQPRYVGSADEIRVAYSGSGLPVQVYVNLYTNQTAEGKLVYYKNSVITPDEWSQVDGPGWWQPIAGAFGGAPLTLSARSRSGERWVVAYAYVVAGHMTSNTLLAQLYYGALSLAGPVGGGVVALAASCETDCDSAVKATASFWGEQSASFASLIPPQLPRLKQSGPVS
jgi:EpsI family protein